MILFSLAVLEQAYHKKINKHIKKMKIGNQNFSSKSPLFVAEISGNHAGDLNILKKTIVAAIKSGANAIKLQTYTPEDLTIKSNKKDFLVEGSKNKWEKKYLYKLYEKGQTPIKWMERNI